MAQGVPGQNGSAAGAIGATLGTAVRVLTSKREGGRLVGGLLAGGSTLVRTFVRVGRLLFLQVTGFVFLCFAVVGGSAAYREYNRYLLGEIGPGRAQLAAAFAAMFLYFGLSSFWRARK
ncbi:MAG TPA: hypothetical protein VEG32_13040 [Clostridia bacterium]|nr:hypothetical protein [Clostridia bacterium]